MAKVKVNKGDPLVCSECAKEAAGDGWLEFSQAFRTKVLSYQTAKCEFCGKEESALLKEVPVVRRFENASPGEGDHKKGSVDGVFTAGAVTRVPRWG